MWEFITIDTADLTNLLKRTQRMANINGKTIPQVEGTILYIENDEVRTCAIVRDGVSSISSFSADIETTIEKDWIAVSNISSLLGALAHHKAKQVKLQYNDNKLVLKSAGKQTTILSSPENPAFAHTKNTLMQWSQDSKERFLHSVGAGAKYTLRNGEEVDACCEVLVNSDDLRSAIESGSMNGQKIQDYTFYVEDGRFCVEIGAESKGKTKTVLAEGVAETLEPSKIAGGLDNILRTVKNESVSLKFFDLTPYGGGMSLMLSFYGGCVFQRECAKVGN
jgi:hypothetical protein